MDISKERGIYLLANLRAVARHLSESYEDAENAEGDGRDVIYYDHLAANVIRNYSLSQEDTQVAYLQSLDLTPEDAITILLTAED